MKCAAARASNARKRTKDGTRRGARVPRAHASRNTARNVANERRGARDAYAMARSLPACRRVPNAACTQEGTQQEAKTGTHSTAHGVRKMHNAARTRACATQEIRLLSCGGRAL